ncbi:hypothetical protein H696_06135 [Fonticula alba]|uniref:Uncharacterized protein n=1 Tax=Fonticula alba TaxID=691883 RepID=A0A058YZN3_FONAL|nr:hypothetical protein H696_06135 [Fonticula alba]KCV67440.1 hypothetical protein H696_06135 [Fonticula alba]|eukprot:XP_009498167.1 hypothetical protein H696_06135 [Fonticula alba]
MSRGDKLFATLDLNFHHLAIAADMQRFFTFRVAQGCNKHTRLPVGVNPATHASSAALKTALAPVADVCTFYVDDITVYSDAWEVHVRGVHRVLAALDHASANPTIDKGSLAYFIRAWIPDPSTVAVMVMDLANIDSGARFGMSPEAEASFTATKRAIANIGSLRAPDISAPFFPCGDASAEGALAMGFAVSQGRAAKDNTRVLVIIDLFAPHIWAPIVPTRCSANILTEAIDPYNNTPTTLGCSPKLIAHGPATGDMIGSISELNAPSHAETKAEVRKNHQKEGQQRTEKRAKTSRPHNIQPGDCVVPVSTDRDKIMAPSPGQAAHPPIRPADLASTNVLKLASRPHGRTTDLKAEQLTGAPAHGHPRPDQPDILASLFGRGRRMIALLGAGVSTAAGIPTFRGPEGVHNAGARAFQALGLDPEAISTSPCPRTGAVNVFDANMHKEDRGGKTTAECGCLSRA